MHGFFFSLVIAPTVVKYLSGPCIEKVSGLTLLTFPITLGFWLIAFPLIILPLYVNFGLVFVGASDGIIRIFDEISGKLLCRLLHYDEDEEITPINDINIFKKHLYISSELDVKKLDLSKIPVLQKPNTKKQTQNTNTKKTITDKFLKELNFKDINECKKKSTKNNNSLTKNELIKKINEYPEIKKQLPANLNSIKKDQICEAIFKLKTNVI